MADVKWYMKPKCILILLTALGAALVAAAKAVAEYVNGKGGEPGSNS